ncbi:hypothetical protein PMAYCL1PPCAC_21606, partial [Pristionchus mayeri]
HTYFIYSLHQILYLCTYPELENSLRAKTRTISTRYGLKHLLEHFNQTLFEVYSVYAGNMWVVRYAERGDDVIMVVTGVVQVNLCGSIGSRESVQWYGHDVVAGSVLALSCDGGTRRAAGTIRVCPCSPHYRGSRCSCTGSTASRRTPRAPRTFGWLLSRICLRGCPPGTRTARLLCARSSCNLGTTRAAAWTRQLVEIGLQRRLGCREGVAWLIALA